VLDTLDEDQPPSKYVRLDIRSPYRYSNTQAQTLATISGPSNNQEPHTQHQAGRISPFPTPSRTLDSFSHHVFPLNASGPAADQNKEARQSMEKHRKSPELRLS
jgi:hypothetical protein